VTAGPEIPFGTTGELHTELKDGRKFTLKPGTSYHIVD